MRKHDTEFNVCFILINSSCLLLCPSYFKFQYKSLEVKSSQIFCDNNIIVVFNILQVLVTQMNGLHHPTESIHILHVGKMRMKLCKGKATIAKSYYSSSMQVFQIVIAV